jgi:ketosteroid isomerase-like protein
MHRLLLLAVLLGMVVLSRQELPVGARVAPGPARDTVVENTRTARALIAALEQKDMGAILARLAEDVTFVLPLAPDGDNDPSRVDRFIGRDAVRALLWRDFAAYRRIAFVDGALTPSADGRTIFVEARGQFLTRDGRPYRNVYLIKLVFDDAGTVSRIEEWTNPVTASLIWGFPLGPVPTAEVSPAGS